MAHQISDDKLAAAGPKPEGQPDGAKPGDVAPSSRYAFDADGRATSRESAAITVGGNTYHRRRKNWEVTRGLRALLRVQEKASNRGARLRARMDALTEELRGVRATDDDGFPTGGWLTPPADDDRVDAIEAQIEDLEGKAEAATDESDEAAYGIIALLLADDDGGNPDVSFLKEQLDVEDAGDLAASLAGGGEPDPTTEATSS